MEIIQVRVSVACGISVQGRQNFGSKDQRLVHSIVQAHFTAMSTIPPDVKAYPQCKPGTTQANPECTVSRHLGQVVFRM